MLVSTFIVILFAQNRWSELLRLAFAREFDLARSRRQVSRNVSNPAQKRFAGSAILDPEDTMKPDLLSEIVLTTFGTLMLSFLLLFAMAAFARR